MALRSMTGFGRSEQTLSDIRISVELKSVNSRFLDLNLRMPKKFNALEGRIRKRVKDYLSRGKLDLYLMYEDFSVERGKLCLNLSLAREYYAALSQIAEALSIRNEPQASRIAEFPDVLLLTEEEGDREKLWARLNACLTEALESFLENREAEGANLGEDLLAKLREMEEIVQKIEKRSPCVSMRDISGRSSASFSAIRRSMRGGSCRRWSSTRISFVRMRSSSAFTVISTI